MVVGFFFFFLVLVWAFFGGIRRELTFKAEKYLSSLCSFSSVPGEVLSSTFEHIEVFLTGSLDVLEPLTNVNRVTRRVLNTVSQDIFLHSGHGTSHNL